MQWIQKQYRNKGSYENVISVATCAFGALAKLIGSLSEGFPSKQPFNIPSIPRRYHINFVDI